MGGCATAVFPNEPYSVYSIYRNEFPTLLLEPQPQSTIAWPGFAGPSSLAARRRMLASSQIQGVEGMGSMRSSLTCASNHHLLQKGKRGAVALLRLLVDWLHAMPMLASLRQGSLKQSFPNFL